jgi:hypothetical protein
MFYVGKYYGNEKPDCILDEVRELKETIKHVSPTSMQGFSNPAAKRGPMRPTGTGSNVDSVAAAVASTGTVCIESDCAAKGISLIHW